MSTVTMPQVRRGVVLDNGWTVVDVWFDHSQEKFGDMRDQGVVLATRADGDTFEPFATWHFVQTWDERRLGWRTDTFTGHYFSGVFPAAKDFARRIGMKGE